MTEKWKLAAKCRGAPDWKLAFGEGLEQQEFARRYCGGCPVKRECGEAGRMEWGVWGGLTTKKRGDLFGRRRERVS